MKPVAPCVPTPIAAAGVAPGHVHDALASIKFGDNFKGATTAAAWKSIHR